MTSGRWRTDWSASEPSEASKRRGSAVTLHFHPNREGTARLGIPASRKVGNAGLRHRLERWAREIFRRFPRRGDIGSFDVVVHFWPSVRDMEFPALRAERERLLTQALDRPRRGRR